MHVDVETLKTAKGVLFMKKTFIFIVLLILGALLFAQTPKFTTEMMPDGNIAYTFQSEHDGLLFLNGNYNLPDTYWFVVLLKGIYLEEDSSGRMHTLQGTQLTDPSNTRYLGSGCENFYNLNRNTEYYVFWKREKHPILPFHTTTVRAIADRDFNPLTPIRR